jgi:hypothetical protein
VVLPHSTALFGLTPTEHMCLLTPALNVQMLAIIEQMKRNTSTENGFWKRKGVGGLGHPQKKILNEGAQTVSDIRLEAESQTRPCQSQVGCQLGMGSFTVSQ